MGRHLLAMGITALATVVGVVVGGVMVLNHLLVPGIVTCVIIVVGGFVGFVMALLNMRRVWNDPSKMLPKLPRDW